MWPVWYVTELRWQSAKMDVMLTVYELRVSAYCFLDCQERSRYVQCTIMVPLSMSGMSNRIQFCDINYAGPAKDATTQCNTDWALTWRRERYGS